MSKNPKSAYSPRGQKQPATERPPTAEKISKAVIGVNANNLTPAWRISSIQTVDPFGWHQIDGQKLIEIHAKLSEFEKRTWNDILVVNKKQNHAVCLGSLCKAARDRLVQLQLDDVEQFVSLRLSGAERVWGIRTHNVLTILWWDPDHEVCPSLKRNT